MVARVRRSTWYKGCLCTAAKYEAWKKSRKRFRAHIMRRILRMSHLTDIEQWDIVVERMELFELEDDIGAQLHALQMDLHSVEEADRDDAMVQQEMELLIQLSNVLLECSFIENDDVLSTPMRSTTGSHVNHIGTKSIRSRHDGIHVFLAFLCFPHGSGPFI